jgi:hypothetical protein
VVLTPALRICGVFASGKMGCGRQENAAGSPSTGDARSKSISRREAGAEKHHCHNAKHLTTAFFVSCSTTPRLSALFQISLISAAALESQVCEWMQAPTPRPTLVTAPIRHSRH